MISPTSNWEGWAQTQGLILRSMYAGILGAARLTYIYSGVHGFILVGPYSGMAHSHTAGVYHYAHMCV